MPRVYFISPSRDALLLSVLEWVKRVKGERRATRKGGEKNVEKRRRGERAGRKEGERGRTEEDGGKTEGGGGKREKENVEQLLASRNIFGSGPFFRSQRATAAGKLKALTFVE